MAFEQQPVFWDLVWVDNLIESMLNLAYSFYVSPYGIVYDDKMQAFTITSKGWRKVVTLVITLVAAVFGCLSANTGLVQASIRTPQILFNLAPEFGSTLLCFTFWYVIWFRKKQVLAYFSLRSTKSCHMWRQVSTDINKQTKKSLFELNNSLNSYKMERNHQYAILVGGMIIALQIGFDLLLMYARICRMSGKYMGQFYETLRNGMLLEAEEAKLVSEMNTLQILLTCMYFTFTLYGMLCKAFANLLCIAVVANVLKNSCELKDFLSRENDQLKVIKTFEGFRDYLEAINQITGPLLFGVGILCAPTFYVANLATILISWSCESPIVWLTICIYAFVLIGAAEVTNKTDEYREWILECGEGENEQQLLGIFVELTQSPVGLRGMECFTITYNFLAKMFSAVVTFTIILLQFQTE